MNYLEYAKRIEQEIAAMKESRKDELLRHLLLQVAEERREEYMHLLTGNALEKDLRIDHEEFITWCQKIEDGNIHFDVQTFIDYEYSPYDDEYEEVFSDEYGIAKAFEKYYTLALDLIQRMQYKDALSLLEPLLHLDFFAYSEESEEFVMFSLEELIDKNVILVKRREAILKLLYLYYQTYEGETRVKKIYGVLLRSHYLKFTLEEIFTAGPVEVKGIDAFLSDSMTHLEELKGMKLRFFWQMQRFFWEVQTTFPLWQRKVGRNIRCCILRFVKYSKKRTGTMKHYRVPLGLGELAKKS